MWLSFTSLDRYSLQWLQINNTQIFRKFSNTFVYEIHPILAKLCFMLRSAPPAPYKQFGSYRSKNKHTCSRSLNAQLCQNRLKWFRWSVYAKWRFMSTGRKIKVQFTNILKTSERIRHLLSSFWYNFCV